MTYIILNVYITCVLQSKGVGFQQSPQSTGLNRSPSDKVADFAKTVAVIALKMGALERGGPCACEYEDGFRFFIILKSHSKFQKKCLTNP